MKKVEKEIVNEYLKSKGEIYFNDSKVINGKYISDLDKILSNINLNKVLNEKYLCILFINFSMRRVFIVKDNKVLLSSHKTTEINSSWAEVKKYKYARTLDVLYEMINNFFTNYKKKL